MGLMGKQEFLMAVVIAQITRDLNWDVDLFLKLMLFQIQVAATIVFQTAIGFTICLLEFIETSKLFNLCEIG